MLTKTEWCWDFDGLVHEIKGAYKEGLTFPAQGRAWGRGSVS